MGGMQPSLVIGTLRAGEAWHPRFPLCHQQFALWLCVYFNAVHVLCYGHYRNTFHCDGYASAEGRVRGS